MKSSKILLNLTSFFCFVYFAIYIFTLVFIPIGIYCFIAGRTFSYKAEHLDETIVISNKQFKNYVIFVSIFCFPFGLLAILPYRYLTSNNIVVSNVEMGGLKYSEVSEEERKETQAQAEVINEEKPEETMEEKMEKFKKLERFKANGFITEEELEQAREQIFGKKD